MTTSVEAIASRLVDQFGIQMDIFQVSENSMQALDEMGMLELKRKAVAGKAVDQKLRMPTDCCKVHEVIRLPNPQLSVSDTIKITFQDIWFPPQTIFVPIPNSDSELELLQLPDQMVNYIPDMRGQYIDFTFEPPFLEFNELEPQVVAVYTAIPTDSAGLCIIPQQAFIGCLYHCAWVYFQPLFLQGKVAPYVWQQLDKWHQKKMARSRNKLFYDKLNMNEMSKVHSIMASFDRKRTRIDS